MEKEIWSELLDSVAGTYETPSAGLVVVGGSPECQRQFIKSVATGAGSSKYVEPIANGPLLGYTHLQFRDDNDDDVSSLDVYTVQEIPLSETSDETYEDLLRQVMGTLAKRNKPVLAALLLDWDSDVAGWFDRLDVYCRALKMVAGQIDESGSVIKTLRDRLARYSAAATESGSMADKYSGAEDVPLGKWVYESPLGADVLISMCAFGPAPPPADEQAEHAQLLVRCVALKHGASVVQVTGQGTATAVAQIVSERLQLPMHSDKPERATPSVVDPAALVIPAGYDSFGKIQAASDKPPLERVLELWPDKASSAIELYRTLLGQETTTPPASVTKETVVAKVDLQDVLSRAYDEGDTSAPPSPHQSADINIGGIQVEGVEAVVRRLRAREAAVAHGNLSSAPVTPERRSANQSKTSTPGSASQNEVLEKFFQNLLTKHKGSPTSSPGPADRSIDQI